MAVTPPIWSYLIADLRTNAILDEVPLSAVQYTEKLNDSGTFTGSWPLSVSEQRDAYTLTTPARNAVYALRDGTPMWGGPIWTRAYDSTTQTVSIGAGDFGSYFDHRKILPLLTGSGASFIAPLSVTYSGVDQNQIARNLIALAASHTGGDIGITLDTTASGTPRDRTYWGYELNGVMDVLKALAALEDGPDFMFTVAQGLGTARPRRLLQLGNPRLGAVTTSNVWEYGGNLIAFGPASDGTGMATRTFGVGDGIEQAALIAYAENSQRYLDGWPLLEAETGYTTVTDPSTLAGHASADLTAARLPIALHTMTVHRDLAPRLGEYVVGDNGQMVIPIGSDPYYRAGIDTQVRIVSRTVSPDASDGEKVVLTCAPVLEDVI